MPLSGAKGAEWLSGTAELDIRSHVVMSLTSPFSVCLPGWLAVCLAKCLSVRLSLPLSLALTLSLSLLSLSL